MAARAAGPRRALSFSPVMAIGILSMAAELGRWQLLSTILLGIGVVVFASIVVANLGVAAGFTEAKPWNRRDPHLALVLFTATAACAVLGERVASIVPLAVIAFGVLAVATWVAAVWAFVHALRRQPGGWGSWEVSGSWLLVVVAPQSLSILASSIALQTHNAAALSVAVAFWVLGIALYCGFIGLVIRRLIRRDVMLDRLTPDYWITMGALAISTVAALDLAAGAGVWRQWLILSASVTFIGAALWVPLLVAVEAAQARRRGLSLAHDILRWSTVFPLGMFSVASYELARGTGLTDLVPVAELFLSVGLLVAIVNAGSAAPTAARALRRIVWCA